MDALKRRVADAVERLGDELTALSLDIHAHPELAFEETHAADRVGRFLTEQGFKVEAGVGGIPTAFRASLETGAASRPRSGRASRPVRDPRSRSCASTTPCPASATPAGTTSSRRRAPARAPR